MNALTDDIIILHSSCIEAYVALGRVQKFLLSAEVDPTAVTVQDPSQLTGRDALDKYALILSDATYSWNKDSAPAISDINLMLQKDCLLSIVGRVGSGKSSLIAALCGDLERVSGSIRIRGSVAFVPQQGKILSLVLLSSLLFKKKKTNKIPHFYFKQPGS